MAAVKLGLSGSEVTLPTLQFMGTRPDLPVTIDKQIEEKRMSDGSSRYNFYQMKRIWNRFEGFVTKAELDVLIGLRALNQTLHFQDNNEDATWYNVIMTYFIYRPVRSDIQQLGRYEVEIVLEEA